MNLKLLTSQTIGRIEGWLANEAGPACVFWSGGKDSMVMIYADTGTMKTESITKRLNMLIKSWEQKAKKLDDMKMGIPSDHPERRRMEIKAGMFRGVAQDLRNWIKDLSA